SRQLRRLFFRRPVPFSFLSSGRKRRAPKFSSRCPALRDGQPPRLDHTNGTHDCLVETLRTLSANSERFDAAVEQDRDKLVSKLAYHSEGLISFFRCQTAPWKYSYMLGGMVSLCSLAMCLRTISEYRKRSPQMRQCHWSRANMYGRHSELFGSSLESGIF